MGTTTREALRQRADVPEQDIDDIIARAAELQERARREGEGRATVAEVQAVASELDIDPTYVDQAIEALRAEREQARADAAARAARTRRWAMLLGVAALSLAVGFGLVYGVLSARHAAADQEVQLARSRLEQALDRQIALAPQLVALAGGEVDAVKAAAEAARAAEGIDARLRAAEALNLAMAEAIGRIQAEGDPQAQQRLLNLQYEVVGTWNRIDTERRRYEEARAR